MIEVFRFAWNATRGHRLRPWQSPYLRWRLETYSGKSANGVTLRDFLTLMFEEKKQVLRFLRWVVEMRSYAGGPFDGEIQ
jgi:hypothetical protein